MDSRRDRGALESTEIDLRLTYRSTTRKNSRIFTSERSPGNRENVDEINSAILEI